MSDNYLNNGMDVRNNESMDQDSDNEDNKNNN